MSKLRIGMSSCIFPADPERAIFKGKSLIYAEESMSHWLMSEGVLSYLIPTLPSEEMLKKFVGDIDGLLLTGGTDVSPRCYGELPLKPEWSGDHERDQYEIALFKECRAQGVPVLGICRGAQVINVAMGGSLYQDISTQLAGSLVHRDWDIYDQNFHDIDIVQDSGLAQMNGGKLVGRINSVHHQGIKNLAAGLAVEAVSREDGVIEAIRGIDGSYVFAVQWHPEFQFSNGDEGLLEADIILKDFLAAVRKAKPT